MKKKGSEERRKSKDGGGGADDCLAPTFPAEGGLGQGDGAGLGLHVRHRVGGVEIPTLSVCQTPLPHAWRWRIAWTVRTNRFLVRKVFHVSEQTDSWQGMGFRCQNNFWKGIGFACQNKQNLGKEQVSLVR